MILINHIKYRCVSCSSSQLIGSLSSSAGRLHGDGPWSAVGSVVVVVVVYEDLLIRHIETNQHNVTAGAP